MTLGRHDLGCVEMAPLFIDARPQVPQRQLGDAPAMEMTVGYLVVVPADRQLTQLYMPRRTRLPNGWYNEAI